MTYYVFVRTPMYGDSNHISHTIEHCVIHAATKSEADFFAVYTQIEAYTRSRYSRYECSTQNALRSLMQSINADITPDIFHFELTRIRHELSKTAPKKQLADAVSKKLYSRYSVLATPSYTLKEVNDYKAKYFQHYIITDGDFNIIEQKQPLPKKAGSLRPVKIAYGTVKV